MDRKITVSRYESFRHTEPNHVETTWDGLAHTVGLFQHQYYASKEWVPTFSPAELLPGTERADSNVTKIHFGVFDLDSVEFEVVSKIYQTLRVYGYAFRIYPTWSYAKLREKRKASFRVLFPFSRSVEVSEWSHFWSVLNDVMVFGLADKASSNPSRSYLVPSAELGTEEVVVASLGCRGRAFDVDLLTDAFRE